MGTLRDENDRRKNVAVLFFIVGLLVKPGGWARSRRSAGIKPML